MLAGERFSSRTGELTKHHHGLRRTDQTNADKLLISAASAISIAGLRTSISTDSDVTS
jgi:hypothetical protein